MTQPVFDAAGAAQTPHAASAFAEPGSSPLRFSGLGDVVADECFPALDLALRRGRHVHKGDERWYAFLLEALPWLEELYRRYGCELVQRSDGYFFLLPVSDSLGKRHLSVAEMIVGQGLALAYLDPRSVENGGVISREELLSQLASVMGESALMHTLSPKRKRLDERVMQRNVRNKVGEALRRLMQLGFVDLLENDRLRLLPSLMRFAEPVRGLEAPSEALAKLLSRGEIAIGPGDPEREDDSPLEDTADPDVADDTEDDADGAEGVETADAAETLGDSPEPEGGAAYAAEVSDPGEPSLDDAIPPDLDIEWDSIPSEDA